MAERMPDDPEFNDTDLSEYMAFVDLELRADDIRKAHERTADPDG